MKYEFSAYGHPSITARHKTTLEFTKGPEVTRKGDCIIGVSANFDLKELLKFSSCKKIRVTISSGKISEALEAVPNPLFNDENELVIRMSEFSSARTFAVMASKSAGMLDPVLKAAIQHGKMRVKIECIEL